MAAVRFYLVEAGPVQDGMPLSGPRKAVDSLAGALGRRVVGSVKTTPMDSLDQREATQSLLGRHTRRRPDSMCDTPQ